MRGYGLSKGGPGSVALQVFSAVAYLEAERANKEQPQVKVKKVVPRAFDLVLAVLPVRPERPVTQKKLAELSGRSVSAVSFALKELESAGLAVRCGKIGQNVLWRRG
jgi:hypothetical protein